MHDLAEPSPRKARLEGCGSRAIYTELYVRVAPPPDDQRRPRCFEDSFEVSRHQRIAEFSYRKSSAHAKIAIVGEMTGTLDSAPKVVLSLELLRYCVDKKLVLAYLGSSRWVESCVRGEYLPHILKAWSPSW